MLFEIVGEAASQNMPLPLEEAVFLMIVLLAIVGDPPEQWIPPPEGAVFPMIVLLTILAKELEQEIPPPEEEDLPLRMVNPSKTLRSLPNDTLTTLPPALPSRIVAWVTQSRWSRLVSVPAKPPYMWKKNPSVIRSMYVPAATQTSPPPAPVAASMPA